MNAWQNNGWSFDSRKNGTILLGLWAIWLLWLFALSELRKKETPNTEKHLIQYIWKEPSPEDPKTITTVQANFSWVVLQSYHEIRKSIKLFEHWDNDNEKKSHQKLWKNQLISLINRLHEIDKRNYEKYEFKESVFNEKIDWRIIKNQIVTFWDRLWLSIEIPHIITIDRVIKNEDFAKN